MKAISLVISVALVVSLASLMSAGAAGATEVDIEWHGDNGKFSMCTEGSFFDNLYIGADGGFGGNQTTYLYGGSDGFDRKFGFDCKGEIYTATHWEDGARWVYGEGKIDTDIWADGGASLFQQMNFNSSKGGVWEQDPWKKQRDMHIHADGDWGIGVYAYDLGGRAPEEFGMELYTKGGSTIDVHFDKLYFTSERDSYDQWWHDDSLTANFDVNYEGNDAHFEFGAGGNSDVDIELWEHIDDDFIYSSLKAAGGMLKAALDTLLDFSIRGNFVVS